MSSNQDNEDADEQLEGNFLKLNAHYVASSTERVGGVLLVTPSSIMFDPNPKDALVLKNGFTKYGVMCNLCYAAGITVFSYSTYGAPLDEESCSTNKAGDFYFNAKTNSDKLSDAFPWIHSIVTSIEDIIPASPTDTLNKDVFLRVVSKIPIKKTFAPRDFDGIKKDTIWFAVSIRSSQPLLDFFLRWQREAHDFDSPSTQYTECFQLQSEYESLKSSELFPISSTYKMEDKPGQDIIIKPQWQVCGSETAKYDDANDNIPSPTSAEAISNEDVEEPPTESLNITSSFIPELLSKSNLISDEFLSEVCDHLPGRCVSNAWNLCYSSFEDGISLRTLYRKLDKSQNDDDPVVILAQDQDGWVFGAFCSCKLHVSEHFYGNGESFLFTVHPQIQFYKWTGENMFFIKGDVDSISFGGGDGTGLWMDGDLKKGSSQPCLTFQNDVLSSKNPFSLYGVEVWGFV